MVSSSVPLSLGLESSLKSLVLRLGHWEEIAQRHGATVSAVQKLVSYINSKLSLQSLVFLDDLSQRAEFGKLRPKDLRCKNWPLFASPRCGRLQEDLRQDPFRGRQFCPG